MKKSLLNLTTMAFLATASSAALATDVTIPNTFTSGTAAVAAEVNDNFTAVKTAVDDNDSRITTNATAITSKADSTAVTAEIAAAVAPKADSTAVTAEIAAAVTPKADATAVTAEIAAAVAPKADSTAVTAEIAAAVTPKADTTAVTANATDITALQQNGNSTGVDCAGNDLNDIMVRVGPLCVDKYEASVWSAPDGQISGLQLGDGADNYSDASVDGIACSNTGNDCTGTHTIYARSVAGFNPSTNITWFQAQQACAASGKRLLTNAEWQMAVAGTPDPTAAGDDGTTTCRTTTAKGTTGTRDACTSNFGANDMIGNVWEMVADWMQGSDASGAGESTGVEGTNYGEDVIAGVNPAGTQAGGSVNMPGVMWRGGRAGLLAGNETKAGAFAMAASNAPSVSDVDVGFRCAR